MCYPARNFIEKGDLGKLEIDIEILIREKLVFRSNMELVPEGSLPRFEYKGKLVRKLYEGKGQIKG